MDNFNHRTICWRDNTARHRQCRRFLECVDEPTRRGALLDLILTSMDGLVRNVKLQSCLGCSDPEKVQFCMQRAVRREQSRLATLAFCRADFGLLRRWVGRVPWEAVLEGKGFQECWAHFKKEIQKAQEQAIGMCQKKREGT